MKEIKETLVNRCGSSYEVGAQIRNWILVKQELLKTVLLPLKAYPKENLTKIKKLFDEYCSGINEEIEGFANKDNHITLLQCIDGHKTSLMLGKESEEVYLSASFRSPIHRL